VDGSPNKPTIEANSYENAKISAEKNAEKMSKLLKIRFIDYISIVPNMADNFSIPKMVREALMSNNITYSEGHYGRPLLDSTQAGKVLLTFIEHDNKDRFTKLLIPGIFVEFKTFAETVKRVVKVKTGKKVSLVKQKSTPEFLKTKIQSTYFEKIGFKLNKKEVLQALEQNAEDYISSNKF